MRKHISLFFLLCFFSISKICAQRDLTLGTDQQYTLGSGSSFDTRIDRINDTHFITIWKESISSSSDVYARIGEVNPVDKTISYGTVFLVESASSNYPDVVVLSETQAVIFIEKDLSSDQGEARVIHFDLTTDNITSAGPYTVLTAGDIRPSSFGGFDAKKISDTQFVVSYLDQDSSEKGIMKIGTVTGNSVSFGGENIFATSGAQYQSLDLIDATTIIVAWEDNGSSNDPGVARVGTISGTTISWGSIYTFHSNASTNANRFNALTVLDNNKFVIAFANHANSDDGVAMVGTRTGDVLSFGSVQTFENSQDCRDLTIANIGGDEFVVGYNGGDGDSSAMYVGKLNGDNINFGEQKLALADLADESRVLALSNNTIVFAYVNEATLFDIGEAIIGTLPNSCDEPDAPTVTVTNDVVASGIAIDLTINGSLGDATAWHVYTTSCGVTELTSSASSPISVTPGDGATTYYIRGEGGCTTPSSCGIVTVYAEGTITTTYTAGAWDNGTPNAAYHAIINDDLTAASPFNAYSLIINTENTFNLNENNLNITTDLTLESGAALLDDGLLTSIGGTQTLKRFLNADALTDFHLVSVPISNGNYEDAFQGSYVYRFAGIEYDNIYAFANGAAMVPGEGVAVSGNGTAATTRSYTGELNKANVDYTLLSTDEWHLLGNPYPAPLHLSDFYNANNTAILPTIYFFNESTGVYDTWNVSLNSGTGTATANAGVAQGFFVEEISSSANQVTFESSMRTTTSNTFLKTTQNTTTGILKIALNYTETMLAWNNAASNDEDINDASYLRGAAISGVYSLLNEKALTIQAINSDFTSTIIPLGFYALEGGVNTIAIADLSADENIDVILVDKYENTTHDLNASAYEFMADASEEMIENRFEIILAKSSLSANENEALKSGLIIAGRDVLNVISENTLKSIRVYDITGALVYEAININSSTLRCDTGQPNAIYLIEIATDNATSNHKVLLK